MLPVRGARSSVRLPLMGSSRSSRVAGGSVSDLVYFVEAVNELLTIIGVNQVVSLYAGVVVVLVWVGRSGASTAA